MAVLWTSDGAFSGGRKTIWCCLRSPRQPPARPQVVGRRGERGDWQRWPHKGRHGLVRSPAGASTVAAAAGGKGAQVGGGGNEGVRTAAAAASKRAQVGQGGRVNRSWWPRGGLSQVSQL